ncbi:MAG TPA: hypothetical protein VJB14_05315 [Planctomycetota bacterium]|nr:hypothetical protein [Planctomycetota bacterium]
MSFMDDDAFFDGFPEDILPEDLLLLDAVPGAVSNLLDGELVVLALAPPAIDGRAHVDRIDQDGPDGGDVPPAAARRWILLAIEHIGDGPQPDPLLDVEGEQAPDRLHLEGIAQNPPHVVGVALVQGRRHELALSKHRLQGCEQRAIEAVLGHPLPGKTDVAMSRGSIRSDDDAIVAVADGPSGREALFRDLQTPPEAVVRETDGVAGRLVATDDDLNPVPDIAADEPESFAE